jgi:hypothetical protein
MVDAGKAVVGVVVRKAVVGVAVVAYLHSDFVRRVSPWAYYAAYWSVRGCPTSYLVGRCLEQDVIGWHYYDSVLLYTIGVGSHGPCVLVRPALRGDLRCAGAGV